MEFRLEKTSDELRDLMNFIGEELGFTITEKGMPLELIASEGKLKIEGKENHVKVSFKEKSHLFRAMVYVTAKYKEVYTIEEKPHFNEIGPMVDCSRNAVMSLEGVKRFITLCAKMGLNQLMLYLEDIYEIPEFPYFGYLRGRYSQKELKEISLFGDFLGVEVIPAIQTLGHLKNPLKWSFANGMRDMDDTLLVGADKTYEFIDAALRSLSESFTTKKVHIGMDEAHNLGRGTYLDQHGFVDRIDLMTEHLNKVVDICEKYQLSPMMWSDMFFRLGSKTGNYYDTEVSITKELEKRIPNLEMVYWDYYHDNQYTYDKLIEAHQKMGKPLAFAGGVWTWNGMAPNYGKTFATTKVALKSAKEHHVKTIYATLWGDDGGETPVITSLLGLQFFAENQFGDEVTAETLQKQFYLFHKLNAEDFLKLNEFDATPGVEKENPNWSNASKLLLYQDILYGVYEKNLNKYPLKAHYLNLMNQLEKIEGNPDTANMFKFYKKLAEVLSRKADMGTLIEQHYKNKENELLKEDLEALFVLAKEIEELAQLHRLVWYQWNKPFGYEVMDLRYGSILMRIKTAISQLNRYLKNEIPKIPELEEEKLLYDREDYSTDNFVGFNFFENIYTVGKISGV